VSTDGSKAPIIIKKKVVGHGGHHGGAWKVAYADFVTAMMALFIVLWLLNSTKDVKEAVAGYFQDPAGVGKKAGTGDGAPGQNGAALQVSKDNMEQLKSELEKAVQSLPKFENIKDQVAFNVTAEGLRIEMLETEKGLFFDSGSPHPSEAGVELLRKLAEELGKLPNRLMIEGHTDARLYGGGGGYSNWELSADRANQARALMESSGVRKGQVSQVRGFADQSLRIPNEPENPANRRVSVIVAYQKPQPGQPGAPAPAAEGAKPVPPAAGAVKKEAESKPAPNAAKAAGH
jgi:chemotaxis protein MotB